MNEIKLSNQPKQEHLGLVDYAFVFGNAFWQKHFAILLKNAIWKSA